MRILGLLVFLGFMSVASYAQTKNAKAAEFDRNMECLFAPVKDIAATLKSDADFKNYVLVTVNNNCPKAIVAIEFALCDTRVHPFTSSKVRVVIPSGARKQAKVYFPGYNTIRRGFYLSISRVVYQDDTIEEGTLMPNARIN